MPMHGIIVLQMPVFIFHNYGGFLLIILLCVVTVLLEYLLTALLEYLDLVLCWLFFRRNVGGGGYASSWICH